MSDEQYGELHAMMQSVLAKQDQLDQRVMQLDRRFEAFADELRDRVRIMETAFLNEVRSIGRRVTRIEDAA